MAEEKDDIDLNELDSIDALLEEAEQALEDADPEVTEDAPDALGSVESEEAPQTEQEDVSEPEAETETSDSGVASGAEPEIEPQPETVPDEAPVEAGGPPDTMPSPQPVQAQASEQAEDEPPLPEEMKQPGAKKNNSLELTDADMDKLKKLILAFGISLIVMVMIGWGLSLWAAIAASTTHLDEETMTLLEELKTGVEHVAVKSEKQDKTLLAVERKIDALSFQLEQLNTDMGKLEEILAKQSEQSAINTPAVSHTAKNTGAHGHIPPQSHAAPAQHATPTHPSEAASKPVVAALDPDVKKTLGSINSRLVRTQKKVEQVYNRLVKLQAQYRAMLAAMKKVEKGLKAAQTKKKAEKKTEVVHQPYYQYQAPAGDYPFDPTHVDSYP